MNRKVLYLVIAFNGILGIIVAVALYSLDHNSKGDTFGPRNARIILDDPMPEFAFKDQHAKERKLSDFKGKALFVQFVFVECPNPCPIMTNMFRTFQKELEGEPGIHQLTVSVNPKRDSPAKLLEYGTKYLADFDTWTFAQGKPAAVLALTKALHGSTGPNMLEHSTKTFLIGPDGRSKRFYDIMLEEERAMMITDARRLVRGEPLQ